MNPSSTICEAKHRYECVVWEARGKKVTFSIKQNSIKTFLTRPILEIRPFVGIPRNQN